MNSSHESQVSRGSWLTRLAITAAGLFFATFATAGTVTISGTVNATCSSWSSVSGDANNLTFVCGAAQANGPGTVTLSAPTSISVGQTVNAGATRSGGVNTAVDVTFTLSGAGCTSSTGLVQWGAAENGTKPITVTGSAAGTCTISLAATTGSPAINGSPKNVTVVSPDANVVFDFDSTTVNNTSFGVTSPTVITVKRTGGSNGDWAVPLSYGGMLASTQTPAAGTLAASAGSTVATLQFPAGSTEASVSFTPAATVPAGFPALPAAGGVTLGAPVPLTVPAGQTAGIPIGAAATRTFNLVAVTGCPVLSNVVMRTLGVPNKGVEFSTQRGQIASFPMPSPMATGGYVQMVQHPGSPVSMDVEIWFSTCPGDVNDPLRNQIGTNQWGGAGAKVCLKSYGYNGGPVYWNKNASSPTTCKLPDLTGPYYVNYRHNTCPQTTCPMIIQLNNTQ
jgi:hypothetical protein